MDVIEERGLDRVSEEFEAHVKATNSPETFPGVIFGGIRRGSSNFIPLTEFSVNLKERNGGQRVPCSICSPNKGKFYLKGYLVYDLDTSALWLLGSTCGRKDLEGWDERVSAYKRRLRDQSRRRFVIDNATKAIGIREYLDELIVYSDQLMAIRKKLLREVPNIAQSLRSGRRDDRHVLYVEEHFSERRLNAATGEDEDVKSMKLVKVTNAVGLDLLAEKFTARTKLKSAAGIMIDYCPAEAEELAAGPIGDGFRDYGSQWLKAERIAAEAANELDSMRRFFAPHNIDCLKAYGKHASAPCYFRVLPLDGALLFKEVSTDKKSRVSLDELPSSDMPRPPVRVSN